MTGDILAKRVAALLSELLPSDSSILVGLSGGVDSVLLLHLLHGFAPRYGWKISALHVHHGISPNADAWAGFCAELCARLDIPLHTERVDIAPLRAHGIEAAARHLRHEAFAAQACDFVALAHHADDQVETLLLQLLRGSGVRGASAMPVLTTRDLPAVKLFNGSGLSRMAGRSISESKRPHRIVRPLLHTAREEIVSCARALGLQWIEDESNADDSYPRNFLRHRLLPQFAERFPAYRETLSRSAQHFAEASELLDELARLDAVQAICDDTLAVSALQALSPPRARNLLRYFMHQLGALMPQAVQLDDMLHQLCDARADASVCVRFGGWQVRRYRNRVHVLPEPRAFDSRQQVVWQGESELDWLDTRVLFRRCIGRGISQDKLQGRSVTLRQRQGGESLRPALTAATRTVKNLLQEQHIPPWQRDRLPLLYCGEELVCVAGVAIAVEYQAQADESGLEMVVRQIT